MLNYFSAVLCRKRGRMQTKNHPIHLVDQIAVIAIGPPGCGKGTVAESMKKLYGFEIIPVSGILRNSGNQKIIEDMDNGVAICDKIVHHFLWKHTVDLKNHKFFFDGASRTKEQARMLLGMLVEQFHIPIAVVHMDLSVDISLERMLARKRVDDTKQVIKDRLEAYAKTEDLILSYLRKRSDVCTFYTINASEKPEFVLRAFAEVLHEEARRLSPTPSPFRTSNGHYNTVSF